jgi:hypothetical protein
MGNIRIKAPKGFYTRKEAMEKLGCSATKFWQLKNNPKHPKMKIHEDIIIGGTKYYSKNQIDKFIQI